MTTLPLSKVAQQNQLWADLLVEELVRGGVELFCLSPGSRSTPLTIAVANNPRAKHVMHFDERGSAFVALGHARATGKPACWITTSGTAVANGLPAIVEANVDGVPLIALTADRPPELRNTSANQTIDQTSIFGDQIRWKFDIPAPSIEVAPTFVQTLAAQSIHRSTFPPGPVHLNMMFREPFVSETRTPKSNLTPLVQPDGSPYTRYSASLGFNEQDVAEVASKLSEIEKGLVIAGRLRTQEDARAAEALAEKLNWPLIVDVCSGLRSGESIPNRVVAAEYVLSGIFGMGQEPEAVVYLGQPAVSKELMLFLAGSGAYPYVVVHEGPQRIDPTHQVSHRFQASVADWAMAVAEKVVGHAPDEWIYQWSAAGMVVQIELGSMLDEEEVISEPAVAMKIGSMLPPKHVIVVGSSMPIRDLDIFMEERSLERLIFANRGASGIDGTIATAVGVAMGLNRPVTVLLGDLSLLHDLNSLALLRRQDIPPITVVAINNDGGGIFNFLPIAEHGEVFEPMFGTPHGITFKHAAELFGLDYANPDSMSRLRSTISELTTSGKPSLIEINTDRTENRKLHQRVKARIAKATEALEY